MKETMADPKAAGIAADFRWRLRHPNIFQHRRGVLNLASLALLLILGWLDYITGYEFGFFIFYFIPVALVSWYNGRRAGLTGAILCALCWYLSDHYSYHPYSRAFFMYWETFMRLVSFLTTALSVSRIRELVLNEECLLFELEESRQRITEMQRQLLGNPGSVPATGADTGAGLTDR
jgi:K+-sensing histidine kinase KdpD